MGTAVYVVQCQNCKYARRLSAYIGAECKAVKHYLAKDHIVDIWMEGRKDDTYKRYLPQFVREILSDEDAPPF